METSCAHAGAKVLAASTPCHGLAGTGGRQRRAPVGGAA